MALKNAVSKVSIAEIFARFETFLFDADGVLWTGNVPVPGAIEFLDKLLADQVNIFNFLLEFLKK